MIDNEALHKTDVNSLPGYEAQAPDISVQCHQVCFFTSANKMELLELQIIFFFVLFFWSLLGSFWPLVWLKILWRRRDEQQEVDNDFGVTLRRPLSMANCMSCGAFLALCLLHLIPQSQQKWQQVFLLASSQQPNASQKSTKEEDLHNNQHHPTNLASTLILLAFTSMLVLEHWKSYDSSRATQPPPVIVLTRSSSVNTIEDDSQPSSSSSDPPLDEHLMKKASFEGQYISFQDLNDSQQFLMQNGSSTDDLNQKTYGALSSNFSMSKSQVLSKPKLKFWKIPGEPKGCFKTSSN